MSEYYHPKMDKTIKIETSGMPGGVSTVIESGQSGTQTLTLRDNEVSHFVEGLVSGGWLPRQLL
jgi:hypothetical protein